MESEPYEYIVHMALMVGLAYEVVKDEMGNSTGNCCIC